jgi:hypothetical protein
MMKRWTWSLRPLAAFGAAALALVACISSAAAGPNGIPDDLPIGEIKTVNGDWRPHLCEISDRNKVVCAIEAFIACATFYRRDLCQRVGLYPLLITTDEYYLYGEANFDDPFGPEPALVHYRLLEFRNLDERYFPPVLLVHLESRICYRIGPPPLCKSWSHEYAILTALDTTQPNMAAWGAMSPPP